MYMLMPRPNSIRITTLGVSVGIKQHRQAGVKCEGHCVYDAR